MCDGIGSGDCFGGTFGCYNTPMNTVGVGDLIPAGTHELGNDFRQMDVGRMPKKSKKQQITRVQAKRPAMQPLVTQGRNSGYDMSPRPLFVPHNPRGK